MMRNAGIADSFIPRANIVKCASRLGAEIVNAKLSAEFAAGRSLRDPSTGA